MLTCSLIDVILKTASSFHMNTFVAILTRLDGEVLAQMTEGWPRTNTVTWTQAKTHTYGILG